MLRKISGPKRGGVNGNLQVLHKFWFMLIHS